MTSAIFLHLRTANALIRRQIEMKTEFKKKRQKFSQKTAFHSDTAKGAKMEISDLPTFSGWTRPCDVCDIPTVLKTT
jgi:hypothetical protein